MVTSLILLAACILLFLSFIHIYWALGGGWGKNAALPIKADGTTRAFTPSAAGTWVVALVLFLLGLVLLTQSGHLTILRANKVTKMICLLFSLLFFLRAIGDFHYVGFFKKVKGTIFARNDTWMYSPLCVFLSLSFVISYANQS
ncbi:DUF3995 domain-containing protein [Brevibacillus ginsengisoli]|uniref:DUF3995 domain-containing protein n=1 Tax=Brevibacillus ginsengisoli TaxID=363854 RepID=UPI003CEC9E33